MSSSKSKTPAEELIESLLKDVGDDLSLESSDDSSESIDSLELNTSTALEGLVLPDIPEENKFVLGSEGGEANYSDTIENEFESTRNTSQGTVNTLDLSLADDDSGDANLSEALGQLLMQNNPSEDEALSLEIPDATQALPDQANAISLELGTPDQAEGLGSSLDSLDFPLPNENMAIGRDEKTTEFAQAGFGSSDFGGMTSNDSEKTVAVAGYQVRSPSDYDDKIKVSVGQNRAASSGYSAWNSGGSTDSHLAQAENLRIAQEKILDLERENEKLRLQNEELMAASEIIKERSDLLSGQLAEYKNDRDGLEDSFKNEIVLLKNHLARKDAELQRAHFKNEELDSRLKFDMKKIRVRERELENRLELIRAEKNAIVKNKDEQILDLRRKMDVLQMEVESYRQKCVELNKAIESSQESFKRTTRALRLAMANLELQEENKAALKKVD
ncbi:hypothetical protein [Pseudobdellovibrio exovorus]|uniref:Uncharacterized protein n=1 Tax=Pseudobdellovibrio exovorus JSS TaxID=1184267 RepID=M4V6A3_9BACT|nr:hypothetical protein [Pseudobdellovibrio exovorus]AGH94902.1 hypothetical protein A11Q_682 [Pseudobdellovibrio exovorus JSS]